MSSPGSKGFYRMVNESATYLEEMRVAWYNNQWYEMAKAARKLTEVANQIAVEAQTVAVRESKREK